MRSAFYIVKKNTWQPSTFYDENTQLVWVMDFSLFKKIYSGKMPKNKGIQYTIHNDVYQAFLYKYKHASKTRKRKK